MGSGRMLNRVRSVAHPGTNPFIYRFFLEYLFFRLCRQVLFTLGHALCLRNGSGLFD